MLYTNDELIREFYDKHPELCGKFSIFKVKEIISSPFQFFKKEISENRFRDFCFKRLGKMVYNSNYVYTFVKESKKLYEAGKISKQEYLKIFKDYEPAIKKHLALRNWEHAIQDLLLPE